MLHVASILFSKFTITCTFAKCDFTAASCQVTSCYEYCRENCIGDLETKYKMEWDLKVGNTKNGMDANPRLYEMKKDIERSSRLGAPG